MSCDRRSRPRITVIDNFQSVVELLNII